MSEVEPRKDSIRVLLKLFRLLAEQNLIVDKTNTRLEIVTKIKINLKHEEIYRRADSKIWKFQKNTHFLSGEEYHEFTRKNAVYNLAIEAENLKHFFKMILDEERIGFQDDDDIMYHGLMKKIFETVQLADEDKDILRDLLLIDFRNSVFHADYLFNPDDDFAYRVTRKEHGEIIYDEVLHWAFIDIVQRSLELEAIHLIFHNLIEEMKTKPESVPVSEYNTLQDSSLEP